MGLGAQKTSDAHTSRGTSILQTDIGSVLDPKQMNTDPDKCIEAVR